MTAPQREPHATEGADVARRLEVDPMRGLSDRQIQQRRARHGPNRVRLERPRGPLGILAAQFSGLIVWLLAAAAALSVAVGDTPEALAIGVVLLVNAAIGFVTELSALRSIAALSQIGDVRARVRRAGAETLVAAQDLVPGDVLVLQAGDVVAADARLLMASGMHADQSILTGESVPVAKDTAPDAPDTPPADRSCVVFKGTSVTQGKGLAVVTATGNATELGQIADLVQTSGTTASPLDKRLSLLGRWLVWLSLGLVAAIAGAGILRGLDPVTMAETAIALAVAAVPEGLPVVATLCLARGMWRIMRRNALVTRLSAVETLGATTVILTDKTGTLTENRMSVIRYLLPGADVAADPGAGGFAGHLQDLPPPEAEALRAALRMGALCSDGRLDRDEALAGDPMELALLRAARDAGFDRPALLAEMPQERDLPFDPRTKMMATIHRAGSGRLVAVKGAPEAVIPMCTAVVGHDALDAAGRETWLDRANDAAAEGARILALACRETDGPGAPFQDLSLAGLVCIADPLREEVPEAVAACQRAGIRVVMLTGDHPATAGAIARRAGLIAEGARIVTGGALGDPATLSDAGREEVLKAAVFARISPEQKQALAALFQDRGEIVAMTGDGVNDAPSLKQADIGIAMGHRGTEVARQTAQMVLLDDRFPTIVTAIREGRIIFDNIRRFVIYLMSCNVSEVLLVGAAVLVGLPPPLMPLQILFLNLVTDVFPAFAVGMGRGGDGVMARPPRPPAEAIVTRAGWIRIAAIGTLIAAASLATFVLARRDPDLSEGQAVTVAFLTLALAQLWNVFNVRSPGSRLFDNDIVRNAYVWWAIGLCLALTAAAIWAPPLSALLHLPPPGVEGALLALGGSVAPLAVWQSWLLLRSARSRR